MNKTYFWKYLSENKIEIPIIQRDYAQGRNGKEYLRRRFLANLKDALDGTLGEAELRLDFVYGSRENGNLQPLDGQQRLTTLWLLHWYAALKVGKLAEASKVLSHFTYETRLSSREFCEKLCDADNFKNLNTNIIGFIERQTWFYAAWKQDPTIQSMLRMLGGKVVEEDEGDNQSDDLADGIEKVFGDSCDFGTYWSELTSDGCPIVFYQMPLEDFGLTDDLYIKMNARGKQLTPFENLKADMIGYIRQKAESDDDWKPLLDVTTGIPLKLDTTWTELFWLKRSSLNTIDEIYLAFINRFFWNQMFMAKHDDGSYVLSVGQRTVGGKTVSIENNNLSYKFLYADDCHTYNGFEPYMFYTVAGLARRTPIETFTDLETVLNRYRRLGSDVIPNARWDGGYFCFIPEYDGNVAEKPEDLSVKEITQIQRIVFFAVCKYLKEGEPDGESLLRWMRLVWNIVSIQGEDGRPQIRTTQAMRSAMELLGKLDSHNVYECLKGQGQTITSFELIDKQLNEEAIKARQILDNDGNLRSYDGTCRKGDGGTYRTWEEIIQDAEGYSFFYGSIRFLFLDGSGNPDWSSFDTKWDNARRFFKTTIGHGQSAMNADYDNPQLLKSLLSKFTPKDANNETIWQKHRSFNNLPATWLYYLLNDNIRKQVHELLTSSEPNVEIIVKPNENAAEANAIYLLTQTGLLDYVMTEMPKSWIRNYNGHVAIYPSSEGVFLNASRRNQFLLNTPGIDVDGKYRINDTGLLFGWNINFKYKGRNFQWYWTNALYLMEDGNPDSYRVKDSAGQLETEKYFCLEGCNGRGDNEIIVWLDRQVSLTTKDTEDTKQAG